MKIIKVPNDKSEGDLLNRELDLRDFNSNHWEITDGNRLLGSTKEDETTDWGEVSWVPSFMGPPTYGSCRVSEPWRSVYTWSQTIFRRVLRRDSTSHYSVSDGTRCLVGLPVRVKRRISSSSHHSFLPDQWVDSLYHGLFLLVWRNT